MNRKNFIKKISLLGASLPLMPLLLESCYAKLNSDLESNFSGKVIIIGAGAAGMAAGYLLQNNNIDFEILEASSVYGGRIRRNKEFADFPIDIGAEWIHTDASVLSEIAGDPSVNQKIETITYDPKVYYLVNGQFQDDYSNYSENKFKSSTWFGFFENYIVPGILKQIRFNQEVSHIDYASDKVVVKTKNGKEYKGDKVLVTVPVKILQSNSIRFSPKLPDAKTKAINNITMVDGIKIFIEFEEQFYPDMIIVGKQSEVFSIGYKIFYDATFKKDTKRNILGLFAVDQRAQAYIKLPEKELIKVVLKELDELFEGEASKSYKKHLVQNWSKEPFIQGAYSLHFNGLSSSIKKQVAKPINNKVFFAGEALSKNNQAQVHGACESAFDTVAKIMK